MANNPTFDKPDGSAGISIPDKQRPIISGIQQVGIGVRDVASAWRWYNEFFGVDAIIFDERAPAEYMLPYTGGKPRNRRAVLAVNLQGGGGFEIWQHRDFPPRAPEFQVLPGDYGIYACKIKCKDAAATHKLYMEKGAYVTEIYKDSQGRDYFYVKDPDGNLFQMVQVGAEGAWFAKEGKLTGGVFGAIVGCEDIEKCKAFYRDMLGYDHVCSEEEGEFKDLSQQGTPGCRFRRVLLGHGQARTGGFSRLLGPSEIELIQALDRPTPVHKIFENRFWGELGFIQICYDIRNINTLRDYAEALGSPFTVDSIRQNPNFDMGDAAGHFAYNEDPSGTLIEYVETCRVPIMKKWNLFLNLQRFNATKPLPNWLVKALRFTRKKDIPD